MGEHTNIDYADHTWSPWIGCTHVHAGCANCYAEALMDGRLNRVTWGPEGRRVKTSSVYWSKPRRWDSIAERAAKDADDHNHRFAHDLSVGLMGYDRPRVLASLCDPFEEWPHYMRDHRGPMLTINEAGEFLPGSTGDGLRVATMDDVRRAFFSLIAATPNIDWLLLTKRPENIRRMWPLISDGTDSGESDEMHLQNVWLGVSVCDQETADRMIPELLQCRDLAPVLWVSVEPMLGAIDIRSMSGCTHPTSRGCACWPSSLGWVVCGGESGADARPMHPTWPRMLRDQCAAADVPFFFKQWGEWHPCGGGQRDAELRVMEREQRMWRIGKKAAGRILDGVIHDAYPVVASRAGIHHGGHGEHGEEGRGLRIVGAA